MEILKKHFLIILISLGLLTRLMLIPLPGFKIDIGDWFAWSIRLSHFNFAQFYSKDVFTDYTPGYLYVLSLLGFLKTLLLIPDNIFYLLLKTPAIIADLIIGIIIYKEVQKYVSRKIALLTLSATIFNPVFIFNSSIWGQIDSILTVFMLVAVIALKKNKLILSSIFFGLALLVKPQALALLPLFAFFLINRFKLSCLFKLLVPGIFIIFILTFPFFPNQTLINFAQHILNTANEYSYSSVNAYNLWGIVGFWIKDNTIWNNLSYQTWGYVLLITYWIILGYFYFKKKLSLYATSALAAMGFFFLPTRVHERYLYPAIVFLVLTATFLKSRLLIVLTGVLSLLHLLNLYYVYVYYNEIYLKLPKLLYIPILYNFLADNSKSLSLISAFIFILISIILFKYAISEKTQV